MPIILMVMPIPMVVLLVVPPSLIVLFTFPFLWRCHNFSWKNKSISAVNLQCILRVFAVLTFYVWIDGLTVGWQFYSSPSQVALLTYVVSAVIWFGVMALINSENGNFFRRLPKFCRSNQSSSCKVFFCRLNCFDGIFLAGIWGLWDDYCKLGGGSSTDLDKRQQRARYVVWNINGSIRPGVRLWHTYLLISNERMWETDTEHFLGFDLETWYVVWTAAWGLSVFSVAFRWNVDPMSIYRQLLVDGCMAGFWYWVFGLSGGSR